MRGFVSDLGPNSPRDTGKGRSVGRGVSVREAPNPTVAVKPHVT
jgi:hypothetical protein